MVHFLDSDQQVETVPPKHVRVLPVLGALLGVILAAFAVFTMGTVLGGTSTSAHCPAVPDLQNTMPISAGWLSLLSFLVLAAALTFSIWCVKILVGGSPGHLIRQMGPWLAAMLAAALILGELRQMTRVGTLCAEATGVARTLAAAEIIIGISCAVIMVISLIMATRRGAKHL